VCAWDSTNSHFAPPAFSFLSRWRPCNIRDTRSEIRSRLASLPLLLYRSLSKRRLTAMVHLPQFPRTGAPPQGAYSAAPLQPSYGAVGMPQVGAGGYGQPPQQMRAPQQQQQQYPAQGQGHLQPPPQQPQQQYGYAAGPVARAAPDLASAGVGQQVQPIASLNPYASRWTIKVRITAKTDLKSWSNPKGSGTLFSIDLLDEAGGESRATFFKCEGMRLSRLRPPRPRAPPALLPSPLVSHCREAAEQVLPAAR